jgi:hypothetical protein
MDQAFVKTIFIRRTLLGLMVCLKYSPLFKSQLSFFHSLINGMYENDPIKA